MFDIGFFELVIIFVLGLIVLGPERLPRVARSMGRWIGKARRTARNLQYELQREIDLEELRARSKAHPINRDSKAAPVPPATGQAAPTPPQETINPAPAEGHERAPDSLAKDEADQKHG